MVVITESTGLLLTWGPAVEGVTIVPSDLSQTLSSPAPMGRVKEARGLTEAGGPLVISKDTAYNKKIQLRMNLFIQMSHIQTSIAQIKKQAQRAKVTNSSVVMLWGREWVPKSTGRYFPR